MRGTARLLHRRTCNGHAHAYADQAASERAASQLDRIAESQARERTRVRATNSASVEILDGGLRMLLTHLLEQRGATAVIASACFPVDQPRQALVEAQGRCAGLLQ